MRISSTIFKIFMSFYCVNRGIISHRLLILMDILVIHAQGLNITGGQRGTAGDQWAIVNHT